jgi:hypothetical protein
MRPGWSASSMPNCSATTSETWFGRLEASPDQPAQWQEAALLGDRILWVTAEELSELGHRVLELVDTYFERQVKPELRPPAARQVTYLHLAFPGDLRPERR